MPQQRQLGDADAWSIAMAWADEIQGRVKLVVDPVVQRGFDLVKSYEWIQLDFAGCDLAGVRAVREPLRLAADARAASITWLELSKCPGFSGVENPAFWKRVFCELSRFREPVHAPMVFDGPASDYFESVTDAIGFFDADNERIFPRVYLRVHAEASSSWMPAVVRNALAPSHENATAVVRVFTGQQGYAPGETERLVKLDALLSKLLPYSSRSPQPQQQRRLPVAIRAPTSTGMADLLETLAFHPPAEFVPLAEVETLFVEDVAWLPALPPGSLLQCCVARQRVVINDHSRVLRLQYLREIVGLTPHRDFSQVCIAELSLYRYELHQPALVAVLSVLPQSRAIDTVSFATFHSPMASHTLRDFDVADWAWLGFAMFHPDAPTSAWHKLKIDLGTITRAKLAAFACMARGNNLLAALSGAGAHRQASCQSHNANTSYYTATLRAGTDVFTSPHGFEATILPGEMTADLCVSSCGPSTFDERVGVVVPGLGLGWIDRQSIISDVVARPPCANAALRHLEIGMIHQGSSIVKSLIALLQLVGTNLETLHIQQCGPVADSQQLYDLVKYCPKLTSLAVSHDGSAWSEVSTLSTDQIARLPQLSHLQLLLDDAACLLYKPPSQASIAHSLRKLQTLTLTGSSSSSSFIHNREAIQTLLHDHQELRFLNWENTWTRRSQRYEQGRQQAWALLLPADADGQDDEKKRRMLFTRGALTRECRAAFLSVVARSHRDIITRPLGSAVGRLDRGVVELVFAFASNPLPRQLWIDWMFWSGPEAF